MGAVFLIAVLYRPTEAERIEGVRKRLIVEPRFVVADNLQAAINKAAILAPRDLDPDRFEVLATNPF